MAYFLKKCVKKGRTYISIVNSYRDTSRKETAHETYKSLGSVETLIENGIEDPIAYYQEEVDRLNNEKSDDAALKISETSPIKYGGYFLVKAVMNKLNVEPIFNIWDLTVDYRFKLYEILCSLVFSRIIKPCSKYKTFNEVVPYLDEKYSFSYDQILTALEYFGFNDDRVVEVFTSQLIDKYGINTNNIYFDCTNYYFEIDAEDDFRRKGPSKENRKDPIVGMGLLLDSNLIPIGMKLYPGNESEKPVLRKVIKELKDKTDIEGKTIQVADKGLNCAINIEEAKKNGDGYLFSKSVKMLPDTEKTWVLLNNDYKEVKDSDGNILYKYKSCIDEFAYDYVDDKGKKHKLKFKEKRLVTYNPSLAKKQKLEIDKMVEKAKYLCVSKAKKSEYGESSKYVNFKGKDDTKVEVSINTDKIDEDKKLAGYNLIVTSELDMKDLDMYNTYHNLWRIEESFRLMKSELDARPVYLQKQDTIKGHFVVCYIATLLIRILQIYELKDEDSYQKLFKFIRDYKFTKYQNKYINMATKSDFLTKLIDKTKLPLDNAVLSQSQFNKIMSYKI